MATRGLTKRFSTGWEAVKQFMYGLTGHE
ncbi:MAG: CaiD, 3-hydroxybutyryl-CoA dehydratase, 3-hydroxybutyryl-CoA dehydratase, partial [Candidatus Rokubacteria bacterium CSP1-6]